MSLAARTAAFRASCKLGEAASARSLFTRSTMLATLSTYCDTRRMRRRLLRVLGLSFALGTLFVACGARTGLVAPEPSDATVDVAGDVAGDVLVDHTGDGPIIEGGPLDVTTDCPD